MKRILVLQNHRIGDLIQSTPVLAGLREKHSPCCITVLVNRMRADVNLGALADKVVSFDQNGFFNLLRDPARSIVQKYDEARRFLKQFTDEGFDLVVDIPADTHMHLIASMLAPRAEVRGVVLSPARKWRYTHPEVMLFYTIGLCREVNRFSLVDLQNLLAGVRPSERRLHLPVTPEADEFVRRFLADAAADSDRDVLVALQAGASEERKRWGEANFGALARLLVERLGAKVILCGSGSETDLAERVSRLAQVPTIRAAGRTDLGQLAALLRRCRILVTNDTGTMHVATAVGTPVVDLSTGPVFFRETGPYAPGSIVVEADMNCSPCNFNAMCSNYDCRERIQPEMVFEIVSAVLSNRDCLQLDRRYFNGVRLHRSVFNDAGRLEFLPVFRYPVSWHQMLGFFYAHLWEVFYGLRAAPLPTSQILSRIEELHDLRGSWGGISAEAARGIDDLRRMESELRAGKSALKPLVSPFPAASGAHQMEGIERLEEIFQRLRLFGRIRPAIRHFTAFMELAVESEAGAEPASAVRNIDRALRFVLDQVKFLRIQLEEAAALLDMPQQHPLRQAIGEMTTAQRQS